MNELLKKADELKSSFKLKEAVEVYQEYFKIDKTSNKAYANAGLCYFLLKDYDMAYEMFSISLHLSKDNDDLVNVYKNTLAIILGKEYSFETVKEKDMIIDNYFEIMEIIVEKGNIEAGFKLFDIFLNQINEAQWFIDPDNQYRVIVVVCGLGDIETAEIMTTNLMKRTQYSWQGLGAFGAVLEAKGDEKQAKEVLERAMFQGGEGSPRFMTNVLKANARMI
ncbi:MAG: hypothetical protein BWY78_01205 [Alphaproteobacteria bacterium ADurb.Bin438]|nr:MAG: hypothetical protein BWY78_01205 [Alphaproteobacteria bacterium ADurb.Bin438]